MVDVSNLTDVSAVGETVSSMAGDWTLLIGAAVLLIATFIVIYLAKNIIANAIGGIIALLIAKFVLGIAIPLNVLTILVTVLGGLGGVAALLIAAYFGWL